MDFDTFVMTWQIQCPWLVSRGSVSQVISKPSPPEVFPTKVLKRPAANSQRQVPTQYVAEVPPPPPAWSQPAPASQPKWASHAVRTLQEHGHLPAKLRQQRRVELTLWSDCGSVNSEMFAL